MTDRTTISRALLSVSDKTGLIDLARALAAHGTALLSTGGTASALRDAGLAVTDVSEHTGFPEILDGRVKTLVPQIHGGILGRRDLPAHVEQMAAHGIAPIDLVVVNLYPFEATVAAGKPFDECVENIDIGGPSLIRGAAKNHGDVAVLTAPAQYAALVAALAEGGTTLAQRRTWAAEAYAATAAYDAAIAAWFAADALPERLTLSGTRVQTLRYGENPHQRAALYATGATRTGLVAARQVQGKELSYNNFSDTDAALACIGEFTEPAVVIVKHANPCGVAIGADTEAAWIAALASDPTSAFGGIVALNRTLTKPVAERISSIFTEVIVAPDAEPEALAVLAAKRNLRVLLTGTMTVAAGPMLHAVSGGFLVQDADHGRVGRDDLTVVTKRAPTGAEFTDLLFAWRCCKHVKSNAILFAHDGATVGVGAGQMSRVDAALIAARKAGERARGAVAASDAFFPFADGLDALIAAGITAVVQPGGSMRDAEVIAAADAAGLAMVTTGMRHFRH